MRRKILTLTLASAALFVPVAAGDVLVAATGLTLHSQPGSGGVVVSGQLRSAKAFCKANRVVRLHGSGAGVTPQIVHTSADGSFRFVLHPARRMGVYVYFLGIFQTGYGVYHECGSSLSSTVFVAPAHR